MHDNWAVDMRDIVQRTSIVLVLAFSVCQSTWATGFYINQQSVRGLGRVDAGNTAGADELGTIFFNPAGLTQIWSKSDPKAPKASFGVHLIIPRSDQKDRGSAVATPGTLGNFVGVGGGNGHDPTDPTPVPNLYAALPLLNGRAAVGVGVNIPFGLAARFSDEWFGRYDAIEASLRTINLSIVGAYRFDSGLSLGAGFDVQYARTSLINAIPNPLAPGGPSSATDARVRSTGHDYTAGFNVGLLYSFNDHDRVGLHYRSGMKHRIEGTSDFTGLTGPLAGFNGLVDVDTKLKLPAIVSAGFRAKLTDKVVLLGDVKWFNWSAFREIRIRFADGRPDGVRPTRYRDTYAVALGAEYLATPKWTLRGGVQYDRTPTVDGFRDTTVPDSNRIWLGLGTTYRAKHWSFDFAFNHVFFEDTRIALTRSFFDNTPLATTVRINSDVRTVTNTLSVDFKYAF